MKKGDLVKYNQFGKDIVGVVTHFDEDGDPAILDLKTGFRDFVWGDKVEILNEEG